jgi:hypothetical protein
LGETKLVEETKLLAERNVADDQSVVVESDGKKELVDLLSRVTEVINGAGFAEEKVLATRIILADGMKARA